jgi:N-acetylglucosamine kinase-like BadF-type ATPase
MIIVESGATKSAWFAIKNGEELRFEAGGIRVGHTSDEVVNKVLQEAATFFVDFCQEELFFYGSGCLKTERRSDIQEKLQHFFPKSKSITVLSDLHAAARAGLGKQKGLVFILGTGSVAFTWDGEDVVSVYGGKGFPNGDEGSGADLGKRLLNLLSEKPFGFLYEKFIAEFGDFETILHTAKQDVNARYFAGFVPFIVKHKTQPEIDALLSIAFSSFCELIPRPVFDEYQQLVVIGGVGSVLKNEFSEVLVHYTDVNTRFLKSPIENLVDYHCGNRSLD